MINRMCKTKKVTVSAGLCVGCEYENTCETLQRMELMERTAREFIDVLRKNKFTFNEADEVIEECAELIDVCPLG